MCLQALHLLGAPLPGQRRRRVRLPPWLACGCLAPWASPDGSDAGGSRSDTSSSESGSRHADPKQKSADQVTIELMRDL